MKLLFYVSKLYSIPVIQPVVKEAFNQKIEMALFVSSKVKKKLPEYYSQLKIFTELRDAVAFDPDFVLCPGNFVDFRLPGIKVELFHGLGIEKESHYKIRHFFDVYFTSGPVVTRRFEEMQKKHGYFRVIETGWPKIDHIINYDTTGIRKLSGVAPDRKIILYAPTHSSGMESANEIVPALETIMKPDEVWFCKPHEFMNREILQELRKKQVRLIDDYDITPYLHLADIMISDTSSVVYEFMALDKPVVTFRTMGRKDKGIDVRSVTELRTALDRSLAKPEEFTAKRRTHLQQVNPRLDGTVSRNIIDQLLTAEPGGLTGIGRKPLNLFRKIQILYHGYFRKGYLR